MSKLAVQQVPATEHHWQTLTAEQAARRLDSSLETGLGAEEAQARLEREGANTLAAPKKFSFWEEFFEELTEPMVLMLLVTGVLYAVWGELGEAITIFVIILVLNTIEVLNELRAKKAIAGLRKLAEPTAALHRGGRFVDLPVEQVAPGDVVILRAGHRVPADARLVEAYGLSIDESMLTGESLPVEKNAGITLEASTPLAERRNLVYSGTLVTRGKGVALVTETGMNAEIGKIAGMTRQVKEPRTHLQQMMSELSKSLVWFALGFSALVPLLGILLAHQDPKQMLLTGLSLAFAMIPEELPIIITMVLALGAFRLSQKHAITKRLTAVEALGSVTVIATDKTGTLTENRMEVAVVEPEGLRGRILQAGALCNDAVPNGADYAGDPLDAALLRAAGQAGLEPVMLRAANPAVNEFTFDNERRRMSVVVARDGALTALVKGAPEALLPLAVAVVDGQTVAPLDDAQRAALAERVAGMAANGLRVIALAERSLPTEKLSQDEVESGLTLLGLVGLADPPRPEAREAIASCQRAGIRTLMITGDHPLTAQ
ncbi:MAG: HAD-IC family P-type ATPase, partial [Chloroflexi bacterium]|nr:HAD-IC family P-type ATPase [Chloroflexota bacterium]